MALSFCAWLLMSATPASAKETFSIDYIVTISRAEPGIAHVRFELAGAEEIRALHLRYDPGRLDEFRGSGKLEPLPDGLRWAPGGPYAHLTYRVKIDHVRGQHQRYDSYAAPDWIVTRAHDLFPRLAIKCTSRPGVQPKSRARLIFRLPPGWRSAAPLNVLAPDIYRLSEPGRMLDRPRGWFALGKFDLDRQDIGGVMVQLARVPGAKLTAANVFHFLSATLPAMQKLLIVEPEMVLAVVAPDPMWHGGISGDHSFFMHADRPLRTPDKTSPYLHELFHVLQPYKPGADADWIEEGLAEFYSLELQRRAGLLDPAAYARALGYFGRFGLWNVDLTTQHDNAATNNSAPLIMYALDQHIQHATSGKKHLDDVVATLVKQGGVVDTSQFRRAVNAVTGKPFSKFFERHVFHGAQPHLSRAR
jgi:hypothetical protein